MITLFCYASPAWQAEQHYCKPFTLPESELQSDLKGRANGKTQPLRFKADSMVTTSRSRLELRGHVRAAFDNKIIGADEMIYDQSRDVSAAKGNIRYLEKDLQVYGDAAEVRMKSRSGAIHHARYYIPQRHAHGKADLAAFNSKQSLVMDNASYSTCNPDRMYWNLSARRIKIDQAKQQGSARGVVLRIRQVPVFYFPYLSFPIGNERKSGFLPPEYSSDGYSFPYYFNLAPNYDDTFTTRLIDGRGVQLINEYRFLLPQLNGNLMAEYLNEDETTGQRRYYSQSRLNGNTKHWQLNVDYKDVSDDLYFSDLSNRRGGSVTHLERMVQAKYFNKNLSATTKWQNFQTIDQNILAANRPYTLKPAFLAQYRKNWSWLQADFESHWTRFDKNSGATADRIHVQPKVSVRWQRPYAFVEPSMYWYYTNYQFNNHTSDTFTRNVPSYLVDSGLFLERDAVFGKYRYLQTLEPRLFFLKTPFQNQNPIPLFDTSLLSFNSVQLFQKNRFGGNDRIGDAEQISLALTNRWINADSGRESFKLQLGQIYFFDDRRVILPGGTVDTANQSDLIFDAAGNLGRWRSNLNLLWNEQDAQMRQSLFSVGYQRTEEEFLALSYRDDRHQPQQRIRQTDVSLLWSVHPRWQLAGRWHYSLEDGEPIEWIAGLQYQSCCFRVRFARRRYIKNTDGDVKITLLMEIELKGLVSRGSNIAELLKRDSSGFR